MELCTLQDGPRNGGVVYFMWTIEHNKTNVPTLFVCHSTNPYVVFASMYRIRSQLLFHDFLQVLLFVFALSTLQGRACCSVRRMQNVEYLTLPPLEVCIRENPNFTRVSAHTGNLFDTVGREVGCGAGALTEYNTCKPPIKIGGILCRC